MQLSGPFDDEYSHGHLGRIRMLNDIDSNVKTIKLLKNFIDTKPQPHAYFISEILADFGNKTLPAYLKEHTIFIVTHLFEKSLPSIQYLPYNKRFRRTLGIERRIESGFFCPECINEDTSKIGFSYWRRQHQIRGATRCIIHTSELYSVNNPSVFETPPNYWINKAKQVDDNISYDDSSLYPILYNHFYPNTQLHYNDTIFCFPY